MSKIFKLFTFALIIFSLTAIYLSTIGVKTDRLNTTIEKKNK